MKYKIYHFFGSYLVAVTLDCQWERKKKTYFNDGIINSNPQITHMKFSLKTMKVIKGANLLMQSIIRYFNTFKIMLR